MIQMLRVNILHSAINIKERSLSDKLQVHVHAFARVSIRYLYSFLHENLYLAFRIVPPDIFIIACAIFYSCFHTAYAI